ncbi:MAG TPA: hypothetical protein VFM40_01500 [Actinomycetota bacterium]|nr:hypothetical protein [Actinomycetota bacterium]
MRRVPTLLASLIVLLPCIACAHDSGREFARYYDEQGMFALNLPAANDITVTPPQQAGNGPDLLTGVVSSPPAPSPSPASGAFGGFDVAAQGEPDQTIYQAFAVTADRFDDLDQMALYFLTGNPIVDVAIDDPTRVDGDPGRLIVADIDQGGEVTSSIAAAITLGDGATGYLIFARFPPGGWDDERDDFERIVRSFRTDVSPGLETFPVDGRAS